MIGLIQRVEHASVEVDRLQIAMINKGILLLLGVEKDDDERSVEKLAKKVANLRIFEDQDGKMNSSILDVSGELLVVSQFTLAADTRKGNRPGFSMAAVPEKGKHLYEYFLSYYTETFAPCKSGQFGANMKVSLLNDGPATFHLSV